MVPSSGFAQLRTPLRELASFGTEVTMSAAGTAMAQTSAVDQSAAEQKLKLQSRMRAGAGWLMAVAIFSVVNSALTMFDAKLHFIVGLGVTQIADGAGKSGGAAGLVITLIAAGAFLLFWKFAREGQQWAFLIGMILYGLDGLIFLGFGLWLDLAFHAFAIFNLYKGLHALKALDELNRQPAGLAAQPIVR
jgi:hypothetical protein